MSTKSKNIQTLNSNHDIASKAFQFLRSAGISSEIRARLKEAGYSMADHAEGSRLLVKVSALLGVETPATYANEAAEALRGLDQWQEQGFRRVRAALARLHPEQEAFVFANLEPAKGAEAVIPVTLFLDRLDELESGPARAATRAEDQAALATLANRGFDSTERARLRALASSALFTPDGGPEDGLLKEREKDLQALAAWYEDWSTTARAVIERRDLLIRLGLLRRRRVNGKEEEVPVTPIPGIVNTIVQPPPQAPPVATAPTAPSAPPVDPYAPTQPDAEDSAPRLRITG